MGYEEDIELLRRAHVAAVIDHHKSVVERMAGLLEAMPTLQDFSCVEYNHCGTSLVYHQMKALLEGTIPQLEKKIAILRKTDIWDYAIDENYEDEAKAFMAFTATE